MQTITLLCKNPFGVIPFAQKHTWISVSWSQITGIFLSLLVQHLSSASTVLMLYVLSLSSYLELIITILSFTSQLIFHFTYLELILVLKTAVNLIDTEIRSLSSCAYRAISLIHFQKLARLPQRHADQSWPKLTKASCRILYFSIYLICWRNCSVNICWGKSWKYNVKGHLN